MDNYEYTPAQHVASLITNVSLDSLIRVVRDAKFAIPYPDADSFDREALPCDFNWVMCSRELLRRKRLLVPLEQKFFSNIVATNDVTRVFSDKVILDDLTEIVPYRGVYTSVVGESLPEERALIHDFSLASAVVVSNNLVKSKFEITDSSGLSYPVSRVLCDDVGPNVPIRDALLKGVLLSRSPEPDEIALRIAFNIRDSGPARFYLRDVASMILTEGSFNDDKKKKVRIVVPSDNNYRSKILSIGKKPGPYRYNPSGCPGFVRHVYRDDTLLWAIILRHEKLRGVERGHLTNIVQGYLLGDIGKFASVVPLCFDLKRLMALGQFDYLNFSGHMFFCKHWPFLVSNFLVHSGDATVRAPDQSLGLVYIPKKSGLRGLSITFGGLKPTMGGDRLDRVMFSDDMVLDVITKLQRGFFVLAYARSAMWKIPFSDLVDGEYVLDPLSYHMIVPSAYAHLGLVWITPFRATKVVDYTFDDHFDRTLHANQCRTYYPFHRVTFAPTDPYFPSEFSVNIVGKSRAVYAELFESEVEFEDPISDDFDYAGVIKTVRPVPVEHRMGYKVDPTHTEEDHYQALHLDRL